MNTLKMKIVMKSPATGPERIVAPAPVRPAAAGGSTDVQEFLAMLARQRKADARKRLWKRLGLLAMTSAAVAASIKIFRAPDPTPVAHAAQAPSRPAPAPAPAAAASPAAAPVAPAEEADGDRAESLAGATPRALPDDALAADEAAGPSTGCAADFAERRWKAALDSCAAEFQRAPEAALALKVAHAQWSRGHVAEAGTWASMAVELGTKDADAFVLIGHAERRAGNVDEAITAYRRYLRWSPRGWHAKRVRAALRELAPKTSMAAGLDPAGAAHLTR